jgi:hypothetical protein
LRDTSTEARRSEETGEKLRDRITGVDTPGEQLASRITGVETPGEQLAAHITGVETPGEQLAACITSADTPGDELATRITGTAMLGEQLAARITDRTIRTPIDQLAAGISRAPQTTTQQAGRRAQGEHGRQFNEQGGIRKYRSHGSQ